METNSDVGKILLKLNTQCYEKGMKNVPVSIKGVRKKKIIEIDRKLVVSQIVRSKEYNTILKQFLKNIDDEIQNIAGLDKVKEIVNDPKTDFYTYNDCDAELLYLYLFSIDEKKYRLILKEILESVYDEKKCTEEKGEEEARQKQQLYKNYKNEIEKLTVISRQRKEKLKELEIKINILTEQYEKLKNKNEELKEQLDEKDAELKAYKNTSEKDLLVKELENQKHKIAIIGKKLEMEAVKDKFIDKITIDEFSGEQLEAYYKVLINRKDVPIAKLRSVKKILGDTGILCENNEEIQDFIAQIKEELNEDRSN